MNEHMIKALFKVETDNGFVLFDDIRQFEDSGGVVGVYTDPHWKNEVSYSISLMPLKTTAINGYHLMTAFGFRDAADPFHWLLIKTTAGKLSYHLPLRPDAGDGTVHAS